MQRKPENALEQLWRENSEQQVSDDRLIRSTLETNGLSRALYAQRLLKSGLLALNLTLETDLSLEQVGDLELHSVQSLKDLHARLSVAPSGAGVRGETVSQSAHTSPSAPLIAFDPNNFAPPNSVGCLAISETFKNMKNVIASVATPDPARTDPLCEPRLCAGCYRPEGTCALDPCETRRSF